MNALTWLHLSDLHFKGGDPFDRNVVLTELLKDIAGRVQKDGLRPDFIAITGDIAFSGKPEEYTLAAAFFDRLLQITNVPKERLFVVPGNHDVDRAAITAGARLIASSLTTEKLVNDLLGSPVDVRQMLERQAKFRRFIREYGLPGPADGDSPALHWTTSFEHSGRSVCLCGLNSAWVCGSDKDDEQGILLGERQVRAGMDTIEKTGQALPPIRIALMHHPFERLREFDGDVSAELILDNFDFVLHGHLHKARLNQLTSPDGGCMRIAGGACYATRDYPNAYNFARLDFAQGQGTIILRKYFDERVPFWDAGVGIYRNASDGKWTFRLSPTFYPPARRAIGDGESIQTISREFLINDLLPDLLNREDIQKISGPDERIQIILGPKYVVNISGSSDIRVGDQAASTSSGASEPKRPNRKVLKEAYTNAFSDDELNVLAYDHFRPLHARFSGLQKKDKIELLLEHAYQTNQETRLVDLLKRYKPDWYIDVASRL